MRAPSRTVVVPIISALRAAGGANDTIVTTTHVIGIGRAHDQGSAGGIKTSAVIIRSVLDGIRGMSCVVPDAHGVVAAAGTGVRVPGRPAHAHGKAARKPFERSGSSAPSDSIRNALRLTDSTACCLAAIDIFLSRRFVSWPTSLTASVGTRLCKILTLSCVWR